MRSQETLVLIIVVSVIVIAFALPILLIGGKIEKRDDIILAIRFTPTATPLDRALTREAFTFLLTNTFS